MDPAFAPARPRQRRARGDTTPSTSHCEQLQKYLESLQARQANACTAEDTLNKITLFYPVTFALTALFAAKIAVLLLEKNQSEKAIYGYIYNVMKPIADNPRVASTIFAGLAAIAMKAATTLANNTACNKNEF